MKGRERDSEIVCNRCVRERKNERTILSRKERGRKRVRKKKNERTFGKK